MITANPELVDKKLWNTRYVSDLKFIIQRIPENYHAYERLNMSEFHEIKAALNVVVREILTGLFVKR